MPERLTSRELDVLRLMAQGLSDREIGDRLHLSTGTVSNHVARIALPAATVQPRAGVEPVPSRLISTNREILGSLAQDNDGDNRISAGDEGLTTLVEIIPVGQGAGASLFTTPDGAFRITEIPPGEYDLWIWWSPGFINMQSEATNPGLVRVPVRVDEDGTTTGALPEVILVREKPSESLIPWPVRSGSSTAPIGTVSLAAEPSAPAPVLPSTGQGRTDSSSMLSLIPVAAALAGSLYLALRLIRTRHV